MEVNSLNVGLAMTIGMVVTGYLLYILMPAWKSYGRLWERIAASFLTLFMLLTLLGIGLTIGVSIVWFYDQYA